MKRQINTLLASATAILLVANATTMAQTTDTNIRAGRDHKIVSITPISSPTKTTNLRDETYPRPRIAGFSPLVAITTSDERRNEEFYWSHTLESGFVGTALNPPADQNYVIGILDSGSDIDLAAGQAATTLGMTGSMLTGNTLDIGGASGTMAADITNPMGIFANGIQAINGNGSLQLSSLVGHSNVSALASPPIECGNGEALTAVIGRPFVSFYNTYIDVDTPITVNVGGDTYTSPQVTMVDSLATLPDYAHHIPLEFGGTLPATTALYYADLEDFVTPITPTMLAFSELSIPTGGAFFTTIYLYHGEDPRLSTQLRVMVDTGAQSSIISPAIVAALELSLTPDFTVDICGIGGLTEGVPGYYIDEVRISAAGGALQFSNAPFVVTDITSPEGGSLDGILGMNFFWNRNIIFEPNLSGSGFIRVSDPIPFQYGDFDLDFDVDLDDLQTFVACMTGPNPDPAISPECTHVDADQDWDVDLQDFLAFQESFSPAS